MTRHPWPVICAHCGQLMPIQSLTTHFKNRHGWKLKTDGTIDPHSNPLWNLKQGSVIT